MVLFCACLSTFSDFLIGVLYVFNEKKIRLGEKTELNSLIQKNRNKLSPKTKPAFNYKVRKSNKKIMDRANRPRNNFLSKY